jgi:segregation and condensation protein A
MDYRVDLSIYNGPLDLLLYLIREREMDIHDIPIAEITEQFLAHLEVVKQIDVDRAGDFLLRAATLMVIKSRMLLPRPMEDEEIAEDLDPRTDLVRQLLEYKQFRDLSRSLEAAEADRYRRFEGGLLPPDPEAPDAGKLLEDVGVNDLLLAFERMMRETLAGVDHQVRGETLPMRDVTEEVIARLKGAGGALPFRELFLERRDRFYIVSVFLAVLEMLRSKRVRVDAGDQAVDLTVRLVDAGDLAPQPVP